MSGANSHRTKTWMEDLRDTLEALAKKPMSGDGLTYAAMELLARWESEAPRSERDAPSRLLAVVARADDLLDAPCVFCAYNGAGYWQVGIHAKDCPFHNVGGDAARADHIVALKNAAPQGGQDTPAASPEAPAESASRCVVAAYRIFKDGDAWCAVNKDFTNLHDSKVGFGHTPLVALGELIVEEGEV